MRPTVTAEKSAQRPRLQRPPMEGKRLGGCEKDARKMDEGKEDGSRGWHATLRPVSSHATRRQRSCIGSMRKRDPTSVALAHDPVALAETETRNPSPASSAAHADPEPAQAPTLTAHSPDAHDEGPQRCAFGITCDLTPSTSD